MKKAIVTGGTGFVGRWLVKELLKQDIDITVVAIPGDPNADKLSNDSRVSFIYCDMGNFLKLPEIAAGKEFDLFFNLAWYGAGGPKRKDYTVQIANVKSVLDAYQAAVALKCKRFVAPGTIGEYMFDLFLSKGITSDNAIYALSKGFTCRILKTVQQQYPDCKIIWCTLVGLYGAGDTTVNLVNYTINELLAGNVPTYGPADALYDFVHVGDAVRAMVAVSEAESPRFHYLIGSGMPRLLKEFLLDIRDCVNPHLPLGIGERPGDGLVYEAKWFNSEALITDTDYKPHFSFKSGIMDTLEWLKNR